MFSWLKRETEVGRYAVSMDSSKEEICKIVDEVEASEDERLKFDYEEVAPFLILARYLTGDEELQGRLGQQMDRVCQLLITDCADCMEDSQEVEQVMRAVRALSQCRKATTRRLKPKQGWTPGDLRRPSDVLHLLGEIDELLANNKLDCESMDYLPLNLRDALANHERRPDFSSEVIHNPSMKGHLIDFYRGCREIHVA